MPAAAAAAPHPPSPPQPPAATPAADAASAVSLAVFVRLRRVFEKADADASGALDEDEFVEAFRGILGVEAPPSPPNDDDSSSAGNNNKSDGDAALRRLFARVDANGDGSCSWDEFSSYLLGLGAIASGGGGGQEQDRRPVLVPENGGEGGGGVSRAPHLPPPNGARRLAPAPPCGHLVRYCPPPAVATAAAAAAASAGWWVGVAGGTGHGGPAERDRHVGNGGGGGTSSGGAGRAAGARTPLSPVSRSGAAAGAATALLRVWSGGPSLAAAGQAAPFGTSEGGGGRGSAVAFVPRLVAAAHLPTAGALAVADFTARRLRLMAVRPGAAGEGGGGAGGGGAGGAGSGALESPLLPVADLPLPRDAAPVTALAAWAAAATDEMASGGASGGIGGGGGGGGGGALLAAAGVAAAAAAAAPSAGRHHRAAAAAAASFLRRRFERPPAPRADMLAVGCDDGEVLVLCVRRPAAWGDGDIGADGGGGGGEAGGGREAGGGGGSSGGPLSAPDRFVASVLWRGRPHTDAITSLSFSHDQALASALGLGWGGGSGGGGGGGGDGGAAASAASAAAAGGGGAPAVRPRTLLLTRPAAVGGGTLMACSQDRSATLTALNCEVVEAAVAGGATSGAGGGGGAAAVAAAAAAAVLAGVTAGTRAAFTLSSVAGNPHVRLPAGAPVLCVAHSPVHKLLLTGTADGSLLVWAQPGMMQTAAATAGAGAGAAAGAGERSGATGAAPGSTVSGRAGRARPSPAMQQQRWLAALVPPAFAASSEPAGGERDAAGGEGAGSGGPEAGGDGTPPAVVAAVIADAEGIALSLDASGALHAWDLRNQRCVASVRCGGGMGGCGGHEAAAAAAARGAGGGGAAPAVALGWDASLRRAVVAGVLPEGRLCAWRLDGGGEAQAQTLQARRKGTASGATATTAADGGSNTAACAPARALAAPPGLPIVALAFNPEFLEVVAADSRGWLWVWDAATGARRARFSSFAPPPPSASASAAAAAAAVSAASGASATRAADDDLLRCSQDGLGRAYEERSVRGSSSGYGYGGRSGGKNNSSPAPAVASSSLRRRTQPLPTSALPPPPPLRPVTCLAFDASCRRLITGGEDGGVRVWNPSSGLLLAACSPPPPSPPKRRAGGGSGGGGVVGATGAADGGCGFALSREVTAVLPAMAAYPECWFKDEDDDDDENDAADGGGADEQQWRRRGRSCSSSSGSGSGDPSAPAGRGEEPLLPTVELHRAFVSVGHDRRVTWIEDGGDGAPLRAFRRSAPLGAEPLCAAAAAAAAAAPTEAGQAAAAAAASPSPLLAVGLSDGIVWLGDAATGAERMVLPAPWPGGGGGDALSPERRGAERVCFLPPPPPPPPSAGAPSSSESPPPPQLLAVGYGDGVVRVWECLVRPGEIASRVLVELHVRGHQHGQRQSSGGGGGGGSGAVVSALSAAAAVLPGRDGGDEGDIAEKHAVLLVAGDSGGALAAWRLTFTAAAAASAAGGASAPRGAAGAVAVASASARLLTPARGFRPHRRAVVDAFLVAAAPASPGGTGRWVWPGAEAGPRRDGGQEILMASASLDGTARLFALSSAGGGGGGGGGGGDGDGNGPSPARPRSLGVLRCG